MKCPHCQHVSDKSQKLKCSQCGQQYERGHIEEFQNLEFLHNWIQDREVILGDQAESLLAEVESRQDEVRDLLGIRLRPAEEVAWELALLEGLLPRLTAWCKAAHLSADTSVQLVGYLQQQSQLLRNELGNRSYALKEPRTLEIFDFALESIPAWEKGELLPSIVSSLLAKEIRKRRSAYIAQLSRQTALRKAVLEQIPVWVERDAIRPTFAEDVQSLLEKQAEKDEIELGEHPLERAAPLDVIQFALQALPEWTNVITCQKGEEHKLRNYLVDERKALEKSIAAEVAETTEKRALEPEAAAAAAVAPKPQKEQVPFDQWLLSERNIKIALYAGGVLLVIAGLIFIGVNWTRIPGPAKFAITVMFTGLMYLGGYLLYQRPAYRIGGVALLGVASGFLTLNFAVLQIYVLGPAGLRNDLMWLIASPLCLLLYTLTAYWTKSDLFTYISMLAVGSTMTAALVVTRAPEAAYHLAFSILSLVFLITAYRLKDTPLSGFTFQPLTIVSHALVLLTFVGGLTILASQSGLTALRTGNPWLAYPTLIIGLVFGLLSAAWSRKVLYSYISLVLAGIIAPATLYLLDYTYDLEISLLVYVLTYAILAFLFLILARLAQNTRWSDISRVPLLVGAHLVMPAVIFVSILGWLLALIFGDFGNPWILVACMGLAVAFYVATDMLFKWLAARWAAALLVPVALLLTLIQLDFRDSAIGLTMMILALAYLGIGYLLETREGRRRSGWPLYTSAYIVASLVTIMAIPSTEDLAMILFADVVLIAVSAAIHRSYRWVYGAVWLLMLPVYLVIGLNVPAIHFQGLLMGLLGLNYTIIGYLLGRRELRLGGPFLSAAAFLSVIVVLMTWTSPPAASFVLAVVAFLYLAAALWLDWTWLLYPALAAVNLMLLSINALVFDYRPPFEPVLTASYTTLGVFLAIGGLTLRRLEQDRWSWPLYLVAVLDLGGAYIASLAIGGWLAILVSTALAILLLCFAWWERALISKVLQFPLLTYLGLAAVFISIFYLPGALESRYLDDRMPVFASGLCALFVLISWLIRHEPLSEIYGTPLRYSGLALMTIPIVISLENFETANLAITLGIAGFAVAIDATIRRNKTLSYSSIIVFIFVSIVLFIRGNDLASSLTLAAITGLYLFMSLRLKNPWLLLPALFAVDLAMIPIMGLFNVNPRTFEHILTISYAVFGVILAFAGQALHRKAQEHWTWPLYILSAFNLAGVFLASLVIGGWLAVAISMLVSLLMLSYAWLERDTVKTWIKFPLLTYLGIGAIFIGHFYILELGYGGGIWDVWPAYTAGLCLLFTAISWLLRRDDLNPIYTTPLRYAGLVLMGIPMIGSIIPFLATLVAVTFAIAGATYAVEAAIRRSLRLVLVSVGAFLVMIWASLLALDVSEPQAYIIPPGLVLVIGGWFARRSEREKMYQVSTLLGLLILMGTAFAQSIITGAIGYAILLALESILSLAWGINSRCRCYVQVGGLALIANAVFQLGPGLMDLPRWIQIGLTGAILLGGGLVALFKREEILSTRQKLTDGWRQWNP
jgi:hypothetical protein